VERREEARPKRSPARSRYMALPRTFQGRLSLAFLLVFAVAVGLVSIVTVFVVDNSLRDQEKVNLAARAKAVAAVVRVRAEATVEVRVDKNIVSSLDELNPAVRDVFASPGTLTDYANEVALADLQLRFGLLSQTSNIFYPAKGQSTFSAPLTDPPGRGQSRSNISCTEIFRFDDPTGLTPTWYLEVSLSNPYTTRFSTVTAVVGFLILTSLAVILLGIITASFLGRRFAAPLRRLTEAAQALARGDLSHPVPADSARTGAAEITELTHQFNVMAAQIQETMGVIRGDRDRSRNFLADVSHELRTPLAALRTFNELLQQRAGSDPAARAEFLEATAQQIDRLDWLAQNLLELSKLDSGLVKLDLRLDDLRTTVESAVEQAAAAAERRGVRLTLATPGAPLVAKHDPPRLGQAVSNLVANALKFTPRGGSVRVDLDLHPQGARIQVIDTGVGIDPAELPHIFERFYRGSQANEARGSGSGLGLAIARSIVEMHGGHISVESRVGAGSTFTIILPLGSGAAAPTPAAPASTQGTPPAPRP
jgi:signal transduction histidine kinase